MGNTLIEDKGKVNLMKAFDTYTEQEIGVRMMVLFENKLFKTIHYKMHQQNLLVKVHLMRKQLTLGEEHIQYQNFLYLKERLSPYPNLMPFHNLINFSQSKPQPNEAHLDCNKDYLAVARQLMYTTLEERLQSNYKLPKCLLNHLALQMLHAVHQLHGRNLYHGHIRSSNFLLTSCDFLILSDLACYKPIYLNELEIIRNVYKSSIQKCTLAPEKYAELQDVQPLSQLTRNQVSNLQMMDMFSVGCVLAEIYTGETLFSLEQLLQFKKGEYEPIIKIEGVIGDLVRNLISIIPEQRYNAQQALLLFYEECCNPTYELLHYVGIAFNVNGYFMQPDVRVALLRKIVSTLEKRQFSQVLPVPIQSVNLSKFTQICRETDFVKKTFLINFQNQANSDDVIATGLENANNLIQRDFKQAQMETPSTHITLSVVQRLKQSIQRVPEGQQLRQTIKQYTSTYSKNNQTQEYVLLALWLFNQLRNCRFMNTRLCGLELLEFLCTFIDETTQYGLIIPNLGYFCEDSEAQVQYSAFTIMLNLLKGIQNPPMGSKETLIFKLYIWEHIKNRLQDINNNSQLALRIGDIAEVLEKYKRVEEKAQFLQLLQKKYQDTKTNELALITHHISGVLKYYERSQTLEILTYLISQINTPQLKVPLLEVFFDIYKYYFGTDTTKILLACLQFNTRHEMSLFHMVRFVRQATEEGTLEKNQHYLKEMAPLMLHQNKWIRDEVQQYVQTLLKNSTSLHIYLHYHQHIRKYLKIDVPHINSEVFTSLIQKPISSKWYEIKNNSQVEPRFPSTLTQRQIINYTNYLEEYLKRSKPAVEQNAIQQLARTPSPYNKFGTRINEFIEAAFRVGLMQMDTNRWEDFSKRGKTWEDFISFMKGLGVDLKSETLTKKRIKYIQELQLQLQYMVPQGSTQWINLLNYTLIGNSIQFKSQQLQIQDVQVQRNITQPIIRPFKISNQLVTTITEHKGIVTVVKKFSDNRRFISGSCDGTVKLYDMRKIEDDFTNGSVSTVRIYEGDITSRVTALCPLEGTDSFVVGTNTGAVSLYTNEKQSSTYLKGDSEIRKIVDQGSTFMYVTEKGTLTIEDPRSRSALRFNIGRQRGLVSSMVQMPNQYTTLIGTINGYLILYDIRSTLIVNLFQLINHQEQPLPIFSIASMNKVSQLDCFSTESTNLVGLGYQSNNNEVGFWDINKQNENLNPALFLYCSDKKHPIIETPRLQSVLKSEQFTNYNNNLSQQCYYDFFNQHHQVDLISYLKDPLTQSERTVKEKWLRNTKNLYINLKTAFESKSIVTSLICLNNKVEGNRQENTFITASSDRSIQSWTLQSDNLKQDKNTDKEYTTNVISSPYNSVRRFKQCPSGDVYTIQDYEYKNQSGAQNSIEHKDCITDMEYMDGDNSYLISASRDHTIKIWK